MGTKELAAHKGNQLFDASDHQMNGNLNLLWDRRQFVDVKGLTFPHQIKGQDLALDRGHVGGLDQMMLLHVVHDGHQHLQIPQSVWNIFGNQRFVLGSDHQMANPALFQTRSNGFVSKPRFVHPKKVRHGQPLN